MKRHIAAILVTASLILAIGVLPAAAQRSGGGNLRPLRGRIAEMNGQSAQLLLYYRVPQPDAAGAVPAEMAQQIASMTLLSRRLEQQGKAEAAQRLNRHIQELRCWREMRHTVTDWAQISVLGLRAVSLNQIEKGNKVRLTIEVEGTVPRDAKPERGTLSKDIEQMPEQMDDEIRTLPDPRSRRRTFFDLVGEVVETKPLTVSVRDRHIQIDTKDQYQFIKRVQFSPRDLRAGQRVSVLAQIDDGRGVRQIRQITILADNAGLDIVPDSELP